MFCFGVPHNRRRPSLTPMIDVVFLLLVFFMLAARFGQDLAVPVTVAGNGGSTYSGPPRLIELEQGGLKLNGVLVTLDDLPSELDSLMSSPDDLVAVRSKSGVPLQDLIDLTDTLATVGLTGLVVVE